MGVGGVIAPPEGWMKAAVDIVRRYGGIFICDEVQTGFGRTGRMWGVDGEGVEPDVVTMAKGIANGYPISAVVTTSAIAGAWAGGNISTFGGNPISCAAASATIDVIVDDGLVDNSATPGGRSEGRPRGAQAPSPRHRRRARPGPDAGDRARARRASRGPNAGRGRDARASSRRRGSAACSSDAEDCTETSFASRRPSSHRSATWTTPSRSFGSRSRRSKREGSLPRPLLGLAGEAPRSLLDALGGLSRASRRPLEGLAGSPDPVLEDLGQLEAHGRIVDGSRKRLEVGQGARAIAARLCDVGAGAQRLVQRIATAAIDGHLGGLHRAVERAGAAQGPARCPRGLPPPGDSAPAATRRRGRRERPSRRRPTRCAR